MRVFGLILVVTATLFSTPREYLLVSTKQFSVQGTTSIGGFECNYDMNAKDTLFFNQPNKTKKVIQSVPVKSFGCGNFILNNDFRKTLKEKEFPNVRIELSNFKKNAQNYSCDLTLNLVGKQKIYKNLPLEFDKNRLNGMITLQFSDFDLTPPKKIGGMIKIKEEIKLSVSLQTE
ncbi:YceI family protein [Flavobacterium lacus]|uniref:YceI-like domain-containing protein n=1 Tax=Flavobacterium lacus TaxID=1353778 RepID=A0A328WNR1_9FLAO|nr:YceI family protein [Flavobacterium lacus]RAR47753.1 YceI-like domain-containing protein [Flavobacterium lacus]